VNYLVIIISLAAFKLQSDGTFTVTIALSLFEPDVSFSPLML
jgi:hypothetical protein